MSFGREKASSVIPLLGDEGLASPTSFMSEEREHAHQLACELHSFIERARDEYDVSYATIIGLLHMKAHLLCVEAEKLRQDEW